MAKRDDKRFTLAEYEEYLELPAWARDSEIFETEADYHQYWARTITEWQAAFVSEYKEVREQWTKAESYLDNLPNNNLDVFTPTNNMAQQKLPFALCGIMRQIALLWGNYPQPTYKSPGMDFDKYTAALAQCAKIEFNQNNFNALSFELGLDLAICGVGCLKTYVDKSEVGPFGKEGKICIERIDPAKMAWDPRAKRLKWSHLGYVMVEDNFDISTAQQMYPGGAHLITKEMSSTADKDEAGLYGTNIKTPVSNPFEGNVTLRDQVNIIECWFKDGREKFEAYTEIVDNSELIPADPSDENNFANSVPNPDYDPDKPEVYTRFAVDEDGYVKGEWKAAYPNGRCIVLGGKKKVVLDFANPYWHKQAPFVFYRARPTKKQICPGDLTNIMIVDMKKNDLLSSIHTMAKEEIERPILAENQAFRKPRQWMRMSGSANDVLVVRSIQSLMRMQPSEIPQFVWLLLDKYDKAFDMVCAIAGVMMGDLAEGAQLSAEAITGLQQFGTGVLKMKAELIAEGMKDLGYQMLWLQRETYDYNIKIPVMTPDGQQEEVEWNDDDASSDWIVDIESGTGLPGADNAESTQAMSMWREQLIDRQKALQMMRLHDWPQIVQRMESQKHDQIEAEAAGRAMGMRIKEIEKQDGQAGRKKK